MQRLGSPTPLSAAEAARRKKRRYQSRTDEEIEAEMDNRGLNYRYGWPLLPPLPVKTTRSGAMQAVHNAAGHLDKVQDILHLQRMHSAVAYFAYRVPNNASHDETNEAFLTLVAAVDTTVPGTFVAAVIQLRQYLKTQEDTRDISIELIDHRAIDGLFTSIIRHNDTAILEAAASSWSHGKSMFAHGRHHIAIRRQSCLDTNDSSCHQTKVRQPCTASRS